MREDKSHSRYSWSTAALSLSGLRRTYFFISGELKWHSKPVSRTSSGCHTTCRSSPTQRIKQVKEFKRAQKLLSLQFKTCRYIQSPYKYIVLQTLPPCGPPQGQNEKEMRGPHPPLSYIRGLTILSDTKAGLIPFYWWITHEDFSFSLCEVKRNTKAHIYTTVHLTRGGSCCLCFFLNIIIFF